MKEWNQFVTHDFSVVSTSAYRFCSNKYVVNNSSFFANYLSAFTPLQPVDGVSALTGTSLNLAEIKQKVSR